MSAVFEAVDTRTGCRVAVKLLPELLTGDDFQARFEREARLVAELQHPNVLPVLDSGSQDGVSYIVEELVAGGTLADQPRPLPLARAMALL
ncbi:MAG TPA: protein kinase, partial [Candidatus Acidoferrales bacterium]|nr:protein kinase [Candidatus Acidoferrales bacterium]